MKSEALTQKQLLEIFGLRIGANRLDNGWSIHVRSDRLTLRDQWGLARGMLYPGRGPKAMYGSTIPGVTATARAISLDLMAETTPDVLARIACGGRLV